MTNWIAIMSGVMVICYFGGILPPENVNGSILTMVLHPENMENWLFITKMLGIASIVMLIGTVVFCLDLFDLTH